MKGRRSSIRGLLPGGRHAPSVLLLGSCKRRPRQCTLNGRSVSDRNQEWAPMLARRMVAGVVEAQSMVVAGAKGLRERRSLAAALGVGAERT